MFGILTPYRNILCENKAELDKYVNDKSVIICEFDNAYEAQLWLNSSRMYINWDKQIPKNCKYQICYLGIIELDELKESIVYGEKHFDKLTHDECERCFNMGVIESGQTLFDGPGYALHNIIAYDETKDEIPFDCLDRVVKRIEIQLQSTSYKYLYGTNICNPQLPSAKCANMLGICGVVVTKDNMIPVGKRSAKLAEYPNCYHVFGGQINKIDNHMDEMIIRNTMHKELEEELFIKKDDILVNYFIGIGRNLELGGKPEVFFYCELNVTAKELENRWKIAVDKNEHVNIQFISKANILKFAAENEKIFSPIGLACITAYNKLLSSQHL